MPRRNLFALLGIVLFCLACTLNVSRRGRVLIYAMRQIEGRALEKIDREELFEGALHGLMSPLDDYSSYITPQMLDQFHEAVDRKFGGVGIEIVLDPETKQLTVASPLVGTPAYEAGILAGDKILRIDGKSTQGLSLQDASDRLRGDPGEPVTLSILHQGEEGLIDVEVVRAVIQVDTVLGETRKADGTWNYFLADENRIGYLWINSFGERTADEAKEALAWLLDRNMRGLIIDVRDDPGGLLMAAIDVCDLFVDSGVIVTTRRRNGSIKDSYTARAEGTYNGFPIAVLVNPDSASASEIVAACLQDRVGAVVVGERTFGKGTVQEIINLQSGQGVLKLTTASYWRPSGKNIHKVRGVSEEDDWGVSPTQGYEVKVDDEERREIRRARFLRDIGRWSNSKEPSGENGPDTPFVDPQLSKALEYVRQAAGG